MEQIKIRTWIMWALVLFVLGLLADLYFFHFLFKQKTPPGLNGEAAISGEADTNATNGNKVADNSFISTNSNFENKESGVNNFLESLQKCAPEVAAQAIATPEAFIEYLRKSVGIQNEVISLENYHITLPDGTKRRIHMVTSDQSNSADKTELRFFAVDAEGYPERLPLKGDETLESLLALGTTTRHEIRSQLFLKDNSTLNLEQHDQKVFEFQYNNQGKVLSCRFSDCRCP
ncbi:hypothetical protein ACES2L_11220 [Bdellovibrio bacteriovorus]